jgi:hypothetical protein
LAADESVILVNTHFVNVLHPALLQCLAKHVISVSQSVGVCVRRTSAVAVVSVGYAVAAVAMAKKPEAI